MRRTISLFLITMLTVSAVMMASSMATAGKKHGCTPGYWKQAHHFGNWVGYSPSQSFSSAFGFDPWDGDTSDDDPTLLQVLKQGGGGHKALGRHAVAALLNAANPDVVWGATPEAVATWVRTTWPDSKSAANAFKRELERANELSCPLGRAPAR